MDTHNYTLSQLRQNIIDNNLHIKAIIQDILAFRGTISELENFNEAGRARIVALKKCIEKLDDWASDEGDPEIAKEVDSHRHEFSSTLQAFRKANISTMLEIEKLDKQELFNTNESTDAMRQRNVGRQNQTSLISQQDSVTEKMLSISRHLSETTQKSAATLETLVASSANVKGTRDELLTTSGTISQSGKLLKKYGRRECTDKVLLFFAFTFFIACVIYIVQKRLF